MNLLSWLGILVTVGRLSAVSIPRPSTIKVSIGMPVIYIVYISGCTIPIQGMRIASSANNTGLQMQTEVICVDIYWR